MFQIFNFQPKFQAFASEVLDSRFNMADAGAGNGLRKFTTDVSLYERGRPEYSDESVEFLLSRIGAFPSEKQQPVKLLEIAAGTGKFTRAMVRVLAAKKADVEVIASDSQDVMCDMFRRVVPGIEIFPFPAENIGKNLLDILYFSLTSAL